MSYPIILSIHAFVKHLLHTCRQVAFEEILAYSPYDMMIVYSQ